jgi:hypothetical protein
MDDPQDGAKSEKNKKSFFTVLAKTAEEGRACP